MAAPPVQRPLNIDKDHAVDAEDLVASVQPFQIDVSTLPAHFFGSDWAHL
jgi:hypothetical protein